MAPRAPKSCSAVGCSTAVPHGVTRCPEHRRQPWSQGGGNPRTTTKDHRARRLRVLQRDGYRCRIGYPGCCRGVATICDHIVALGLGGPDTDANCQAACGPCSARKAGKEGNQAMRATR